MKQYKKTLVGTLIAFFIGTSCCWLSSLAIWIGGVTFAGVMINFLEETQLLFITLGLILLIATAFLYLKRRGK